MKPLKGEDMKINLREAGRLRREVEGWLNKNLPRPEREVSIHTPEPKSALSARRNEVVDLKNRYMKVLGAYYLLRQEVGVANSDSGIDGLLAQQAKLQRELKVLENLTEVDPPGHTVVAEEIHAEREKDLRSEGRDRDPYPHLRSVRRRGFSSGDEYNVLDPDIVQRWREEAADRRRELRAVQDQLLRLNLETEIDLAGDAADTLKDEGLL